MLVKQHHPQMADCEIAIMDSIFATNKPQTVLEWGAGGSTLYWPPRRGHIRQWVSIEALPDYHEYYSGQACEKVEIRLRAMTPADYAYRLLDDGRLYDLILVDGACRIECLQTAPRLLASRGIVVLHDAGRNVYLPGWKAFPHHELLYAGELPDERLGYKHRGLAVFWQDKYVKRAGWYRSFK